MEKKENYTPQQIADWLHENIFGIQSWIDGLAETLQHLTLCDDCGLEKDRKDAMLQVAGARQLLQELHQIAERMQRNGSEN